METKEKIAKHINSYKAKEVKMLYEVMANIVLGNSDFNLILDRDTNEIISIINEDIGKKLDYNFDDIISKESLETFSKIAEIEYSDTKLKKSDLVGLISDVLSDDTLFEGFCLAFTDTDEDLLQICEAFGCLEQYKELAQNKIYKNRKNYMHKIVDYLMAAVNLYGVIHVTELEYLILDYENKFNLKGYNRISGSYKNTIMYNPKYFCLYTLQNLIGRSVRDVHTTMDGYFLHYSFTDEYQDESERMLELFKEIGSEITEQDFGRFYDSMDYSSYRILIEESGNKQMYTPSKNEFLKYADENYREVSEAEKQMRSYLERKFLPEFASVAKKVDITTKECLDDYMDELYFQVSDVGNYGEEKEPLEFIQFLFTTLEYYNVSFEDEDQANELLGYAMAFANSVRLWFNLGHTPIEVMEQTPFDLENTTIVPRSSSAAEVLAEGQEQLRQMGINIDLDSTSTNISSMSFDNGINGPMRKTNKKVYPNDPCPCGSGMKFKKCCGR